MLELLFCCVAAGQLLGPAEIAGPSQAVDLAEADIQTQAPAFRHLIRYLDLSHLPAAARARWRQLLAGHVNELSIGNEIRRPASIAGGRLLRINLEDYGWPAAVFDQLAAQDPWFHQNLIVHEDQLEERGFRDQGGNWIKTKSVATGKKIAKATPALAPWLGPKALALAQAAKSQCPIVRGDWFLWQTAIQAKRQPGYYDFLGIKKQADFERLVGFSSKLQKDSGRLEKLEAVSKSGVSRQPRRIGVFPTIGGMQLWVTYDSEEATDRKNPLRILDNQTFEFDATEQFGALPNNLWVFLLADAKGNRQDSAPDFVGYNARAHGNDGKIHIGLSCKGCHFGNDGINPFDGWARNLYRPPLRLQSPDPAKEKELRAQYLRDLAGVAEDDRRVFARALAEACDMKPKEYAIAYTKAFAEYEDDFSGERAAAYLGVSHELFVRALDRHLKETGAIDPVLGVYLLTGKRAFPVPILQFHEVVPEAMKLLRRMQP